MVNTFTPTCSCVSNEAYTICVRAHSTLYTYTGVRKKRSVYACGGAVVVVLAQIITSERFSTRHHILQFALLLHSADRYIDIQCLLACFTQRLANAVFMSSPPRRAGSYN